MNKKEYISPNIDKIIINSKEIIITSNPDEPGATDEDIENF